MAVREQPEQRWRAGSPGVPVPAGQGLEGRAQPHSQVRELCRLRDHGLAQPRAQIIRQYHGDGVGPRSSQDIEPGADMAQGWLGKAMGLVMG